MKASKEHAIRKAVAFLCARQLPGGEFPTFAAPDVRMQESLYYGSPFLSSFVLYALRDLELPAWRRARDRALGFLLTEQETGGLWRNHNRDNPVHADHQLPLDLDDTAAISYILQYFGVSFTDNRSVIRKNRDHRGRFLTWIDPPFDNEVDGVVNANVLLYLGDEGPAAVSFLLELVATDQPFSRWYPDRLTLYYTVSRLYENGFAVFERAAPVILQYVPAIQLASGGFGNDLRTALALNILANFRCNGAAFDKGTAHLLRTQRPDGGWNIAPFYRGWKMYYGSEELTTALAVEALHKSL